MPAVSPTSPTSAATWTVERIELLKSHFHAGLSCREIAADIGVSRNAVIGKLSRLNLTRGPKREERSADKSTARALRTLRRLQYELLSTIDIEAETPLAHVPIDEANRCSLMELTENRCRWPISTPGADDFCFCGNASPDGQSYCTGHARLAYRPNSRARLMRG
ncbi:GcrA family cell cycle regulator [Bradyrhizobium sp. CCGUVB23]|uniref:GcrA family cell cycle regulator n=1 Tax=Bradyrhizobium sp. CCGUVB23 TaxID=2949630 RepID=UPI0020B4042E|nr:GcrA family cell cycle regulator [Bradyrhizobium sp. CCGUVB23]MCP3465976.1 GcrA family cell cycle regulator [Bradyrhizobium sp. CCGUVB23]